MSDDTAEGAGDGGASEAGGPPQIAIVAQYVKDLSFENPNAPQSLTPQSERPQINVTVDVQARALQGEHFEVTLGISATGRFGEATAFVAELLYGAVFLLRNIPAESLEAVCVIECPRLVFPFARRIIADVTRDGGLPPLMLDPIDFVALYRQNKAAQSAAGNGGNGVSQAPDAAPTDD